MRMLFLLVLLFPNSVLAGWTLLRQLTQPVSCGYFFDENRGFVGTGHYYEYGRPRIWKTTDGGTTWVQTTTPSLGQRQGRVTSIFMKDGLVGYASISEENYNTSFNEQALWKTTDGGSTWFDHTQGNTTEANCVYATPYALMVTGWTRLGSIEGGRSLDDGATYQHAFSSSGETQSNGVDFTDDLQGVVTPGPSLDGNIIFDYTRPCHFTTDGGRSWQEGAKISESWSVHAIKGTSTFFAFPEGYANDVQTNVIRTTNTGMSWQTRFTFRGGETFTGHIDGAGKHLYVQTDVNSNLGLYRSDDLGLTWKNVNGPSNWRDSRFVVTGCNGQVVYAFDTFGNIWKTDDGGDGTLSIEEVELGEPEPLPERQLPFKLGDTLRIPVYVRSGGLTFTSYRTRISLNTDLLTPIGVETLNTISKGASTITVTPDLSGASVEVTFPAQRTINASNRSVPLCYILATVYLTRDTTTEIAIDSFSMVEVSGEPRNILACNAPSGSGLAFSVALRCGDPTLYHFLRDEPILDFSFIRPNPNSGDAFELTITAGAEVGITLESVDMLGRVLREFGSYQLKTGENVLRVGANGIASDLFYFRLRSAEGTINSRPVALIR